MRSGLGMLRLSPNLHPGGRMPLRCPVILESLRPPQAAAAQRWDSQPASHPTTDPPVPFLTPRPWHLRRESAAGPDRAAHRGPGAISHLAHCCYGAVSGRSPACACSQPHATATAAPASILCQGAGLADPGRGAGRSEDGMRLPASCASCARLQVPASAIARRGPGAGSESWRLPPPPSFASHAHLQVLASAIRGAEGQVLAAAFEPSVHDSEGGSYG